MDSGGNYYAAFNTHLLMCWIYRIKKLHRIACLDKGLPMQRKEITMWNDRTQVKKGNVGEEIVKSYLESNGCIIYKPITDRAHAFDNLVTKDKQVIFIAEVKTKPKRLYYPDTGLDLKNYKEYIYIYEKYKLNIFIFFVDEIEGKIYGNYLNILNEEIEIEHKGKRLVYPKIDGSIIYFPLVKMRDIAKLSEEQINEIKMYNQSNYYE